MNYKLLGKILGKIMILEGVLMIAPLIVSIIYKEYSYAYGYRYILAFAVPIVVLFTIGILLQIPKPKRRSLYQKEGFALVATVWIVMALFGAIPFVINRDIPNYIDACFEIMSGFTTTGASIIDYDITSLAHSSLFWRSFSHWIGGMGILVFVLIFIPESNDGSAMHLLRAESPGPQVGKIVSKMRATTRILYLIYIGLTVLEIIVLSAGPLIQYDNPAIAGSVSSNDKFFHALLTTFGSAGTGGFGFIPNSMEYFTPFAQYTISIFLLLFGCNFTLYFLILIGKIKDVLRSEELRTYTTMIVVAVGIIFASLLINGTLRTGGTEALSVEESFRHSLFQVASIITTTGFSTQNFDLWPQIAKVVFVLLMFTGAMAGSTAGGIKISRLVIAFKGIYVKIRKLINPRYVPKTKFEGKTLEEKTTNDVFAFISLYIFIILGVTFVLSFDGHGFFSDFSSTLACISNIGPGFDFVGPYASYADYNYFSKILLTITMLIGRLEILPVLILFSPRTWKRT